MKKHNKYNVVEGERFGRLIVVRTAGVSKDKRIMVLCRCDCGGERVTKLCYLKTGTTRSCGCLKTGPTPGATITHGQARIAMRTVEYQAWCQMKYRCSNPSSKAWKNYGGRGIEVCARWMKSFEAFLDDVGPRPGPGYSLGRKNNDEGYEPSNVEWQTVKQQANNRRRPVKTAESVKRRKGTWVWRNKDRDL